MSMWLSALFVLSGAIITFIAAVGLLRLPDFFMRMHAATKAGVVGPSLLLIGVGFYAPTWTTWIKIALSILFLSMTTPIAAHLLGRAGFLGGVHLWRGTARNDLDKVLSPSVFDEAEVPSSIERPVADKMLGSPPASPEH